MNVAEGGPEAERARAAEAVRDLRITAAACVERLVPAVCGDRPEQRSAAEALCDRLVDSAAAEAWLRTDAPEAPDEAHGAIYGCVRWVVQEDLVRTRSDLAPAADRSDTATIPSVRAGLPLDAAHGLVARLVGALADAGTFDLVSARLRAALGACPEGRARGAWEIVDAALDGLGTTRHEWVGQDPAIAAAGGWVLVERLGRLQLATAFLAEAIATSPASSSAHLVDAVRRYTWNWLRQPPPEAATTTHVRRTDELLECLTRPSRTAGGIKA